MATSPSPELDTELEEVRDHVNICQGPEAGCCWLPCAAWYDGVDHELDSLLAAETGIDADRRRPASATAAA
jgi:hypothetical protein